MKTQQGNQDYRTDYRTAYRMAYRMTYRMTYRTYRTTYRTTGLQDKPVWRSGLRGESHEGPVAERAGGGAHGHVAWQR